MDILAGLINHTQELRPLVVAMTVIAHTDHGAIGHVLEYAHYGQRDGDQRGHGATDLARQRPEAGKELQNQQG